MVDQGTTISLILPRASGEVEVQRGRQEQLIKGDEKGGRLIVFVVEDDEDVAAMIYDLLGRLGHESIRASYASSALGMLADGRHVDLVLSDVMISGVMNRVELADEIRRRRPDMPIVLNSGYTAAAQATADAMGVETLRKPFTFAELRDAIASAMDAKAGPSSKARPMR